MRPLPSGAHAGLCQTLRTYRWSGHSPSLQGPGGQATRCLWQCSTATATDRRLLKRLSEARSGGKPCRGREGFPVTFQPAVEKGSQAGRRASRCKRLAEVSGELTSSSVGGHWEGGVRVVAAEEAGKVGRGLMLSRAWSCVLENVGFSLQEMGYSLSWMTASTHPCGRENVVHLFSTWSPALQEAEPPGRPAVLPSSRIGRPQTQKAACLFPQSGHLSAPVLLALRADSEAALQVLPLGPQHVT